MTPRPATRSGSGITGPSAWACPEICIAISRSPGRRSCSRRRTGTKMADTPYGLGRRGDPDQRDCLDPVSLVLAMLRSERRSVPWTRLRVLNQGQTGTCVGHGWRGWYEGEPTTHAAGEGPDAFAIYRKAILLDAWADNDREENLPETQLQCGSSVRAGAQAMQETGFIASYVWATKASEIADYVTRRDGSPVV